MQTDLIGSYIESDELAGVVRAAIPLPPGIYGGGGLMLWVQIEDGSLRSVEAQRVRVRSAS